MKNLILLGFALAAGIALPANAARTIGRPKIKQATQRPSLVLVLVIDQFRADYLQRFESRFRPPRAKSGEVGGFRYLIERGSYWPAARYDVLQSITCPGHAMILSGSYPYLNGIIMNEWFDAESGRTEYCVSDAEFPLVKDDSDEIGREDLGASPKQFHGSTVGDELKNAGYPTQVVSVALKDRAAIMLGGKRADLAFWLSKSGRWTTSRYYLKSGALPKWMQTLNAELEKRRSEPYAWTTDGAGTGFSSATDQPFAVQIKRGAKEALATPLGIDMTVDAALAAADAFHLGRRSGSAPTDILAVSFSSHDILGHQLGPNAREMEELTVAEDLAFSRLLNGLRKRLPHGLDDVVIAMTADHGVAPRVDVLKEARVDSAFIDKQAIVATGEKALTARFGPPLGKGKWIAALRSFHFYFDRATLAEKKTSLEDAESTLKASLESSPGVAFAFSRFDWETKRLPPGMHERQINKSYVSKRSGDVILIPQPFYMESGNPATHMTGYAYDRTVPLLLSGPGVRKGVHTKTADIVDLAPTLSFLLGALPPALSEGRVLDEARTSQAAPK